MEPRGGEAASVNAGVVTSGHMHIGPVPNDAGPLALPRYTLWTFAWTMGTNVKAPGVPPAVAASVGPTSPGMALTLFTSGAQSEVSGTRSLSSSGSTQSAAPSWSVSTKPLSTLPSQSSSIPLQTSVVGVPGVQVCGRPPAQLFTVLWQAPTPQVVAPRPSSMSASQSSSTPLHTSRAPGWTAGSWSLQSTANG